MSEFQMAEVYLRHHRERIARNARNHHMTSLEPFTYRRNLTPKFWRVGSGLWKRITRRRSVRPAASVSTLRPGAASRI